MRILVVTQYFWPENFRINDLCLELTKRGHQVTVLTGVPNYPEGNVLSAFKDNPKEFSNYHGVEVIRVPMVSRGQGSSIRLVMNYLSYAVSASVIGLFKLRKRQFDSIFVFEPSPITVGIPAIVLKKVKKVPIVFWVLDLWPETLQAVGVIKSERVLTLVGRLVSYIYNQSDLVLGQSKSFFKGIEKYCKDRSKIKYFPSWSEPIFSDSHVLPVDEIGQYEGSFKIVFAGNIGEAQDFPSIVKAAECLQQRSAKVKFFIVGDGRMFDWLKSEIESKGLQDFIYLMGRHPLESMPRFYGAADALLVSLKPSEIFSMTIPGKVQTYMLAGKPILGMLDGEGAKVISDAKAGLVCSSGDYEGLAENAYVMSKIDSNELVQMAENANTYAEHEFNRDKLISQLEEWFFMLAKTNTDRRG